MPGRLLSLPQDSTPIMDHLKRPHLPFGSNKRHPSKDRTSKDLSHHVPTPGRTPSPPTSSPSSANTMNMIIESPPNIFHGDTQTSSGALFSGQLIINIVEPQLTIQSFSMQLLASVTARKPVAKDCPECAVKETLLFRWTFIAAPKTLRRGRHPFPFSYLLPGHLPASTSGALGTLEYFLDACALPARAAASPPITHRRALPISRALMPAPEKNSLRIFPPTNLTAHVTMSPTIHPIGESTVLLRLSGVTEHHADRQQRWRLRKLSWRLEEHETMISPACPRHAAKLGGQGKGIQHEDVRPLGAAELKDGWKSDFADGCIELEFRVRCAGPSRPLCDVASPTGLYVTHQLILELVVAEEWVWKKRPAAATPSGAARVLRAQFAVVVTERAGLGISWDEEQPPMYEDVPASPPMYGRLVRGPQEGETGDYLGPPLTAHPGAAPDEEVDALELGERLHVDEDMMRPRARP